MRKHQINKSGKRMKFLKQRLALLVASPLAIAITAFALVSSVSAAVVVHQVIVKTNEKTVQVKSPTDNQPAPETLKEVPKNEESEPSTPIVDPNHQDLATNVPIDASIEHDPKTANIHDMSQSFVPTCINGWNYVAPNGDIRCLTNSWNGPGGACNYAVLTRVKDGVDETTLGLSPGVRQGINCSGEATKAAVLDQYNVVCQDGTQSCVKEEVVDITRNPSYTPPNGQE